MDRMGQASGEAKKVKAAARTVLSNRAHYRLYSGDEAGSVKGLNASNAMGKTRFQAWSMSVKVEGKNVTRPLSMVGHSISARKKGAPMQMAAPASVTVILEEIDASLAEHKRKIAQPGDYDYAAAKKLQEEFERKLQRLLNRLTMSPQATPELQVMVNELAATVAAAARGK